MSRLRAIWRTVRRIWIVTGITVTIVLVTWSVIAYRADREGREASISGGGIEVSLDRGIWRFRPSSTVDPGPTLIFLPGALVDPRAYAPLLREVARSGRTALMVELPRRGAMGGAESPELGRRIRRAFDLAESSVVLAGHSRGAVVAVREAATGDPRLQGLILIATTHPRDYDLVSLDIPVTKVVGTRDGIAPPDRVRANAGLLPSHTEWVWVEGGNHSRFGWYGFQPLDRWPEIEAEVQRGILVNAVLDLLDRVEM